jgi:S1-C subfamily serine protease
MSEASGGWYVRSRGRILGPFAQAQLESLRDRGQLSQFHELSRDRRVWVSASTLEGLFGANPASAPAREDPGMSTAPTSATTTQDWFYNDSQGTQGPMSAEQILALLRGGRIRAETPIWREGFASWMALREVPEFAHLLAPMSGSNRGPVPPISQGTGVGFAPPFPPVARQGRSRLLLFSAVAGALAVCAVATVVLVIRARKDDQGPIGMAPTRGIASRRNAVDSHMSGDIPHATGLVVSGVTITVLTTGEVMEIPMERGTCFAINSRGGLLTNRHVVEEYVKLTRADDKIAEMEKAKHWRVKPELWVYFAKDRYDAKVIFTSGKYDMAVLKVDREGPYFRISTRPTIPQGAHIYALGFPAASSQSLSMEGAMQRAARKVSENIESVLDESDFRYSITDGIISLVRSEAGSEYIQHSAEISGGNSGGPLIYDDGSVLGINTLVTFNQKEPGVGVKYYALTIAQAIAELRRRVPNLLPE